MKSAVYICSSQTAISGLLKMIIPQKFSGRLALVFAFFSALNLCGQNLISNYSFEDTVSCPDDVSQIGKSKNWYSCGPTPDYYNACNKGVVGVPDNLVGFQNAAYGTAYSGIETSVGFKDYREVIGQTLTINLVKGKKYYVGFNVSLSDKSVFASNNLGILFSTYPRETAAKPLKAVNYAHVFTQNIIENFDAWTTISGSFIADSSYAYLMISNFFADSITIYKLSKSASAIHNGSYYYIDNVCVSEDSSYCSRVLHHSPLSDPGLRINVFPNPLVNVLNINSGNPIGNCDFVLYDINSKQLIHTSFLDAASIDVSDLSAGLYYYKITNAEGRIKSGLLTK